MDLPVTLALILPWAIIAFQAWLITMLLRQHGRALLAQDELRAQVARLAERVDEVAESRGGGGGGGEDDEEAEADERGLPIGSPAPDFALPDLDGRQRTLKDFLGQPLVVTFFSTQCGFCTQMAPRLGQLAAESPRILLISRGDPEEHKKLAAQHKWKNVDVVFQENWEISGRYQASGTPTGYLVDAEGRIASPLAIGSEALLRLRAPAPSNGANGPAGARVAPPPSGTANGRAGRKGLAVGAQAPEFSLPDLDEAQRSLSAFRGKRVLLLFSEPDCEPCETLAPWLVEIERRGQADNLAVLMVSRGDAEANRSQARQHGSSFPVLLQQSWEVSRQYGAFAAPVGYLIDEQGAVAAEMAVGPEAIRKLV